MKKFTKALKKVWKGVKKVGKVLLAVVVVVAQALASPKRAGQPGSGGRYPRRDEEGPSDIIVDDGQQSKDEVVESSSKDEVVDSSSKEIGANEQDNNTPLGEQDLPEGSYLGNSWLDTQYERDSNYSPLGLKSISKEQNESFNSRYSLGIDPRLNSQRNSIDSKNFNNNSPEKQQRTPQNFSLNSNITDRLVLEKFVRDDPSLSFSPQDIQGLRSKLDAQYIKVDRFSNGSQDTVVIEYRDQKGNSRAFINSIDGKGNSTSLLLDLPSEKSNNISEQGAKLIFEFEESGKVKLKAYPDPATGKEPWTIGIGTTRYPDGTAVKPGDTITKQQALEYFRFNLSNTNETINRHVKVPVTQNQRDALGSFIYNFGEPKFKNSTLLKKLNQRDYQGAADEFSKWNKGGGKVMPGLTRRRQAERDLFLGNYKNEESPEKSKNSLKN